MSLRRRPLKTFQSKLDTLLRKVKDRPIKRDAAGGLVIKHFQAASVWDLQVLIAWTHPKYGSTRPVLPKGGLDPGESLAQGAAREVYEETGVKAKIVDNKAHIHTSTFGSSADYDLELVLTALKQAHPAEREFIESSRDEISNRSFIFKNVSRYFVMTHVSGRPRKKPGRGHGKDEMAGAEWMSLRQAYQLGGRIKRVIKTLRPVLERHLESRIANLHASISIHP